MIMKLRKTICFIVAFLLLPGAPAYSQYAASGTPRLSSSIGLIVDHRIIPDTPLVIHIQDLHCNAEVQKNIARIIDFYSARYPGCPILAEGAPQGMVNLAPLRMLPDRVRTNTFELMLKKGLMSGGEYSALKDPLDRLYGIEHWKAYKDEVEIFRQLFNARESVAPELARLDALLSASIKKNLSSRQQRLERFIVKDTRDETWYGKLPGVCAEWNVPLHRYPAIEMYLRLQTLNRSFHWSRIQKQGDQFLTVLQSTLPYRDYALLVDRQTSMEELFFGMAQFFAKLSPRAQQAYPDLAAYMAYLSLQRNLNPIALFRDENALVDDVCIHASRTPAERAAFTSARLANLLAEGINTRLTAEGYAVYTREKQRLVRFLENSEEGKNFPRLTTLIASGMIERYYDLSLERDAIFSDAIVAGTQGKDAAQAVIVITGGFHGGLTARLKAKGISYVSIMPAATAATETRLYDRIMINDLLPEDTARATLAPVLNAVGIEELQAAAYTAVLTQMAEAAQLDGTASPETLAALIKEWIERCRQIPSADADHAVKLGQMTVQVEDDACLVSGAGVTVRLRCTTPRNIEKAVEQLTQLADIAGISVAQNIDRLAHPDRAIAALLGQNTRSTNIFASPQPYRDLILKKVKVTPLSPLDGKSSVYWFPTRFCPVGCADCYFSSKMGGKDQRNRETTYDVEGVNRLIDFMNQAQTQQLTIAGGGEPLMEKATVLEVIRRANVETLIVVTSGYWGKDPANARQMIVDLYQALATANERRRQAGLPPMKMFLRISTDQYHAKQLTLQPTINIIHEFHQLYTEIPEFKENNIQLYLKTLDGDPSFSELCAQLKESEQVDIEEGWKLQVKDLMNVNLTGIIRFRDNFKVLVRSVPLFYSDPEVNMSNAAVVQRNATIFREKNAEKCMLDDGRIVFGGWREKGRVVGINWHMPYDGRVQIWGTTAPDNDSYIYRQSYQKILSQQLADIISLAMIEKGSQYVEQIVSEVNPKATLRAEAVNIPDWYSTIAMEDAKTRLYVTIRLLQEYYREGRVFDRQFKALPRELKDLIHQPREYLMGLYHMSGYNIVDEYLDYPTRLRYVDEYGRYHATPKAVTDKLVELARLVEKQHYADLDISGMRDKVEASSKLSAHEKTMLEKVLGQYDMAGKTSIADKGRKSVVLLTGVHGSGKTTLAAHLAEQTGLPYVKKGEQLRQIALAKGYNSVTDYIKFLNAHPNIKRSIYGRINGEIIHRMLQGDCIIDDNLAPWLAELMASCLRARNITVIRVNVHADLGTRARRTAADPQEGDGNITNEQDAARQLQVRDADEQADYLREYGVTIGKYAPDIDVDSSQLTIDEVFDHVYRKLLDGGLLKADPPKDIILPDENEKMNIEGIAAMNTAA